MSLLQEGDAVGDADGRRDDLADEFLLETVHAQVISQPQCLDEKRRVLAMLPVNIHQPGLKVLLQQHEDSRRDPRRHRNLLSIAIRLHPACCASDFPQAPASATPS